MFTSASFENHWDMLLREFAKKRQKRNINIGNSKIHENAFCPKKQNNSYLLVPINTLKFELQGCGWELSKMRISYKLTKITSKTEELKKNENIYKNL